MESDIRTHYSLRVEMEKLLAIRRMLIQNKAAFINRLFRLLNPKGLVEKKQTLWTVQGLKQVLYGVNCIKINRQMLVEIDVLSEVVVVQDAGIQKINEQMNLIWRDDYF